MRHFRERANMTQVELAEAARIEPRYVQDVERARALQLSVVVLDALARALDVDVRFLLRASELPPARPGRPPTKRTRQK